MLESLIENPKKYLKISLVALMAAPLLASCKNVTQKDKTTDASIAENPYGPCFHHARARDS